MKMYQFTVEFVFNYMVILVDVDMQSEDGISEEAVIHTARENLMLTYNIDPEALYPEDVIIHDKNYGYIPPSQTLDFTVA
jgi:hypothetical protein